MPGTPEQPSWLSASLPAGLVLREAPARPAYWIFDNVLDEAQPPMETVVALDDWASAIKYPRRMRVLGQWAAENDLQIEAYGLEHLSTSYSFSGSVYTSFRVVTTDSPQDYAFRRIIDFGDTICYLCSGVNSVGTLRCVCGAPQICSFCMTPSTRLHNDGGTMFCGWCAGECVDCAARCNPDYDICSAHGDRPVCDNCVSSRYVESYNGRYLCESCAEALCSDCGRRFHEDYYVDDFGYVCRDCYNRTRFGDFQEREEIDETANVSDFSIPTIPGREVIRNCGIEIEGGGRPVNIIVPLASAGLTNQVALNGYHFQSGHAPRDTREWSVEHDGSVDWELVSPQLNMAVPEDVAMLNTAVRTLRDTVHSGDVSLDMRCGLHVHVSAARIPVGGAYKLKGYWDYLEDVIFRLGAARWPFHRAVLNGGEYTRNTPKQGMSNKLDFARYFERNNDRYFALSFANYFRTFLENCTCGAVRYDTWDKCTCDLGKCTFEFRVFNTTANPTKIHGYLALCQALVAKAADGEDVENIQDLLPPLAFEPIIFEKADAARQALFVRDWEPRVRWIFNELPLTDDERKSLLYCVENSELKHLGSEFAASLNPAQVRMEVNA